MAADLQEKTPLDELMVAMDVVDTLRHQQSVIDREVDEEGRRGRLLERLREMYKAQGIDVPDRVLQEGIQALEEERFQYQPVPSSFSTRIARFWVNRRKWKVPLLFLTIFFCFTSGHWLFNEYLPEQNARKFLPNKLDATMQEIESVASNPADLIGVREQYQSASAALKNDRFEVAGDLHKQMEGTLEQLRSTYTVRVVSRANEMSGLWRVPDVNQSGRNYYLVVEAINATGSALELPVRSEETGKISLVKKWGLRVNEDTFLAVAEDKQDDGIIQGAVIGEKRAGALQPEFTISTTGAAITRW